MSIAFVFGFVIYKENAHVIIVPFSLGFPLVLCSLVLGTLNSPYAASAF